MNSDRLTDFQSNGIQREVILIAICRARALLGPWIMQEKANTKEALASRLSQIISPDISQVAVPCDSCGLCPNAEDD